MNELEIEQKNLTEAKARAYDILANIEMLQNQLSDTNIFINKTKQKVFQLANMPKIEEKSEVKPEESKKDDSAVA